VNQGDTEHGSRGPAYQAALTPPPPVVARPVASTPSFLAPAHPTMRWPHRHRLDLVVGEVRPDTGVLEPGCSSMSSAYRSLDDRSWASRFDSG